MSTETTASLLTRAGLPANEAECIGKVFAFTYTKDDQETRLVGKIDGLKIKPGSTPTALAIISSGIRPINIGRPVPLPELIFWEAHKHHERGMLPAGWQLAFYNRDWMNPSSQSDFFEGKFELLT